MLGNHDREPDDVDRLGRVGPDVPAARFEETLVEAVGVVTGIRFDQGEALLRRGRLKRRPLSPAAELLDGKALLLLRGEGECPREDLLVGLFPGYRLREEAELRCQPGRERQAFRASGKEMPENLPCFLPRRLRPQEPSEKLLSDVLSRHSPSLSYFENARCLWYCKSWRKGPYMTKKPPGRAGGT